MIEGVYFLSLFLIVYTYLGYPAVLYLIAATKGATKANGSKAGDVPFVSLVIAAYNEEQIIGDKVQNSLELDWPADKLEVLVVSDGSTDRTNDIVSSFSDPRVRLLAFGNRGGQCVSFDRGAEAAKGDIILFSDATGMFNKDVATLLADKFTDSSVGCVAGTIRYKKEGTNVTEGISSYWRFENYVKKLQSEAFSNTTISGCIHAIRKELYTSTDPSTGSDMVVPMTVIAKGYKVLFEPRAITVQTLTHEYSNELERRIRIPIRGLTTLLKHKKLIDPLSNFWLSFHVLSHKGARWLAPVFFIAFFASNAALIGDSLFYKLTMVTQAAFYALAILGYMSKDKNIGNPLLVGPYYFCLLNLGAFIGLVKFISGKRISTWEPAR